MRRDFRTAATIDDLLIVRAEMVAGAKLARTGVPFDFGRRNGATEPDLMLRDMNLAIEVKARRLDGLQDLREELQTALADISPPVLVELRTDSQPLVIKKDVWDKADIMASRAAATGLSVRALILRLARENPGWGYRRIHGELLVLGVQAAASTVREILKETGIDPAPERGSSTWTEFLHSQADALPACDFFEAVTLSGTRLYVLAVIGHSGRRIHVLGATAHPTASWETQAAGNLVMDLEDVGCRARFVIRDRDGKYPALFDTVLEDARTDVVPRRHPPRVPARGLTCTDEILGRDNVPPAEYEAHHATSTAPELALKIS